MLPVDGETQLFRFEGRTLHLTGKRKDPILLKDHTTGEVLWDRLGMNVHANAHMYVYILTYM